jgi:hypothetical protein
VPNWDRKYPKITNKLEVAICGFKFKVAKCDLVREIKVPKWYLETAVF